MDSFLQQMAGVMFTLLLAFIPTIPWWLYTKLVYARLKQYAYFPQPPTSLLFGHVKIFGKLVTANPERHMGRRFSSNKMKRNCADDRG